MFGFYGEFIANSKTDTILNIMYFTRFDFKCTNQYSRS